MVVCGILSSDVTMKNTIISNNDADGGGGGLRIAGDSTRVTLRQSSFISIMMQVIMVMKYIHLTHQTYH